MNVVIRRSLLSNARFINFTDTVEFKEKQKVPHSYSRAEENARFANGVRDDATKKDYINSEIALALHRWFGTRNNSFAPGVLIEPGGLKARFYMRTRYYPRHVTAAVDHVKSPVKSPAVC